MSASRDQLNFARFSPSSATIPTAVAHRPALFGLIAGSLLALGVLAGVLSPREHQATAVAVLNDQRTSDFSSAIAADRFANEQIALFELDEIQDDIARRATEDLASEHRLAEGLELSVGAGGTTLIGPDGTVRLAALGADLTAGADGAVAASDGRRPRVRADGVVLDGRGAPVSDAAGRTVRVSDDGQVVVRWDGTVVVNEADGTRVVTPEGMVLDPATAVRAPVAPPTSPPATTATTATTASTAPPTSVPAVPAAAGLQSLTGALDIAVSPTGRLLVRSVGHGVELVPGGRAVVVDDAGNAVEVPGADGGVGRADRILLGRAGNVAAVGRDEAGGRTVTAVDLVGAVVVVDAEGRVARTSANATVGVTGGLGDADRFTPEQVDAALAVRTRPNSTLLDITYRDRDALRARVGANASVAAYQAFVQRVRPSATPASVAAIDELVAEVSDQLRAADLAIAQPPAATPAANAAARLNERDLLRQRLQALLADRDRVMTATETEPATFSFVSEATRVSADRGLGPLRLGVVGAFVGLVSGAIVAYVLERRRPRLSGAHEAEAILGVPLLAEVPDHRHEHIAGQLPVSEQPATSAAEAYRFAAAALGIAREERGYRRVGIVSASVGDGKTTVAANVALALSQGDQTVVAVDADLEGQVLSFLYLRAQGRTDHWQGIADVLTGECTVADALCPIELPPHHVDLLSGGSAPGRARALMGTDAARRLFDEVARRFDIAVVDLPPLLNLAYVARVLRDLDAVVVVLSNRSARRDIEELADRLRFIGVPIAGYIMCRAPLRSERTASVPALVHDLGGRPTDRRRLARLSRGARSGG